MSKFININTNDGAGNLVPTKEAIEELVIRNLEKKYTNLISNSVLLTKDDLTIKLSIRENLLYFDISFPTERKCYVNYENEKCTFNDTTYLVFSFSCNIDKMIDGKIYDTLLNKYYEFMLIYDNSSDSGIIKIICK